MKKFYLLVFLVFAGVIQGCSVNMNSRLLKMDEGQELWITDIIPQDEGELIILQGDLSKSKIYEHCEKIKSIQAFNHWDIALLVINKSGTGNVYMIYPYYNALDTFKLIFEVNEKITGKVIEKEYYGPPNYGETPELDAKEIESIICFDEPKNFFVDERLAVIKEMQLVFYKSFYKDSDFIPGKRYSFTGRIIPAETGHHHTDYIFLVDDYNLEENQIE